MRSIFSKLALAFLAVAMIGVGLVTLIINQRTISQFNTLEIRRFQFQVEQVARSWYVRNGSWDGIDRASFLVGDRGGGGGRDGNGNGNGGGNGNGNRENENDPRQGRLPRFVRDVVILDENQRVVYRGRNTNVDMGEQLKVGGNSQFEPIWVDRETVGWVKTNTDPSQMPPPASGSFEYAFLEDVRNASLIGAVGVGLLALLLGLIFARTLAQPIRELTEATDLLGAGQLGHQVDIQSRDEIGTLATAFNRMSHELNESQQLRRQMTADIAHDLRTPLSVILGYTEALSDGKLRGDPEIYTAMYREAQHLNHLIDDLRTLSLADSGELSLNKYPVPAGDLLQRVEQAYRGQAAEKGVRLSADLSKLSETGGKVLVDAERINQVLGNLVSNALRHTSAQGEITLSAAPNGGDTVQIKVADTGIGIAAEHLPYIFERFYRGDESRKQNEGESGLGLAIVKSLIDAHGGQIGVKSQPGRGTTFTILLPTG